MSSLSERLDGFSDLSPAERAGVERDVAASGSADDVRRLAEARTLATLLGAAADARPGHPITVDDVADMLADESLGLVHPDAERIHAAIGADPNLKAEADRIRARLGADEPRTETPSDAFERLFGGAQGAPAPLTATPRAEARTSDRPRGADRAAAAPPRRARFATAQRVLMLAAFAIVAYGGLYAVSESQRTDRARVAHLRDLDSYTPRVTRSADGTNPLELRLDAALDDVVDARRAVLGLFPHFDTEALDRSAAELADIIRATDSQSTVSQEARLALARVRLYQNRDGEAVRLLGTLVRERSYRAPEARRLLDFVRTQSAA